VTSGGPERRSEHDHAQALHSMRASVQVAAPSDTNDCQVKSTAMNFGRVLVAVDFSSASNQALSCGAAFARDFNALMDVIHVVDPRQLTRTLPSLERRLTRLVRLVPEDLESRTCLHLDIGMPADCIVSAAHARGVDAILLGRGRDTPGSTLERVRQAAAQAAVIAVDARRPPDATELLRAVCAGMPRTRMARTSPLPLEAPDVRKASGA
jgi:nucleotide-binding universal stress UspA family protein